MFGFQSNKSVLPSAKEWSTLELSGQKSRAAPETQHGIILVHLDHLFSGYVHIYSEQLGHINCLVIFVCSV